MNKSTVVLIVILVLLGITAYLVLQQPGERSTTGESGQQLVHYDSSAVDRIELRSPQESVVLEKTGGSWMITSPIRYRADSSAVMSLLNQGNHIALKNLVSSNPEKQSLFQVDSTGLLVRLSASGTQRASFRVGKPSSTFSETFVRNDASSEVFLADGYLLGTFKRKVNELRDKTIFKTETGSITVVTYHYGDTTFTLSLKDTVWKIGNENASESAVRPLISSLSNIQADDFIDSAITAGKPTAMIELPGMVMSFQRDTAKGGYKVQTSSSPQWFTCPDWRATPLLKRKKDLLASPA